VTVAALGWRGGDRLTLTADAWVMIARRDPGSMVTVPTSPYIVIRPRCPPAAGCGPVIMCCWPPCLVAVNVAPDLPVLCCCGGREGRWVEIDHLSPCPARK
jgi:hypothetical protein